MRLMKKQYKNRTSTMRGYQIAYQKLYQLREGISATPLFT
jgi:hypothetical protein